MVIAPRFLWLFVFACCTLAYTPALDAARPTGRLPVKFAFLNYEPFFEYTNGVPFNKYYWQAFGDLDPHACIDMLSEGWRRTTDNMLDIQVVYTTNVDLFPYHATVNASNQHRYTDSTYWNHAGSRFAGENSNGFTDLSDYITCITADFPQVIGMIERGEVDHVMFGGGRSFGYYESVMIGKGASRCNSDPRAYTNERCFTVLGMNCERAGNGAHPIGHGFGENMLAQWFFNQGSIGYAPANEPAYWNDPQNQFTNINEFVAFTRYRKVTTNMAVGLGNVHWAPNGTNSGRGYDYYHAWPVLSHADNWIQPDYPHSLTNAPRMIAGTEWGLQDEADNRYGFGMWWWNHFPQAPGLYRGHLNNWITYGWNWWTASYPIGSDQVLTQSCDLAGWFTYQIQAPPGTTQLAVQVTAPVPVVHAVRKNLFPRVKRPNSTSDACDALTNASNFTWVLTNGSYGKTLEGTWYVTFGASTNTRQLRAASICASLSPKPTNSVPPVITVTAPAAGDRYSYHYAALSNIAWRVSGLPQGTRQTSLDYRLQNGTWAPICVDYNYQLYSPYRWFFPASSVTGTQVRVIVEDVYGCTFTNYSGVFDLRGSMPWQESALVTNGVGYRGAGRGLVFDARTALVKNYDNDGYVYLQAYSGIGFDSHARSVRTQSIWRVAANAVATGRWELALGGIVTHQAGGDEGATMVKYHNTFYVAGFLGTSAQNLAWRHHAFYALDAFGRPAVGSAAVDAEHPRHVFGDKSHPVVANNIGGALHWRDPYDVQLIMTDREANGSGADVQIWQFGPERVQTDMYREEQCATATCAKIKTCSSTCVYDATNGRVFALDAAVGTNWVWCATNIDKHPGNLKNMQRLLRIPGECTPKTIIDMAVVAAPRITGGTPLAVMVWSDGLRRVFLFNADKPALKPLDITPYAHVDRLGNRICAEGSVLFFAYSIGGFDEYAIGIARADIGTADLTAIGLRMQ